MSGADPIRVDSRRWTGPAWAPSRRDRREARAIRQACGGPGADAPRRAAAAVSWIGLGPMLATTEAWARVLGPVDPVAWLRARFEAWLVPRVGIKDAEGILGLIGDPRLIAPLLALAGAAAGGLSVWRHRAAVSRGLAAVAARRPEIARHPPRGAFFLPALLLAVSAPPAGAAPGILTALALWLAARFLAGAMVGSAERLAVGPTGDAAGRSAWDAADLVLAGAALLATLGHILR